MKYLLLLLCFLNTAHANAPIKLLIKGGVQEKTQFYVLPITYKGDGVNPSYEVEEAIKVAISGAGLFSMSSRLKPPQNVENLNQWNFLGVRFILTGQLFEEKNSLILRLSVQDTLTQKGLQVSSVLMPDRLKFSVQLFADQVYRTLFYAAHTNLDTFEIMQNEDTALTNYMHSIVKTFKNAWSKTDNKGSCLVHINQMPGGGIFTHNMQENCFHNQTFAEEISEMVQQVEVLPYEHYQEQFNKSIHITFSR
ncbi:hypothetical protein [Marinicella rhabdoformis]|uniref:hypothetical protein n=1 Tax=Marinicella rhabdoformis TaxID=2580566 RepID=UPI0012AEE00D|nr:hypothetical protein [Marinicella rhabdoformis]